jgi:hypothetical protein
MTTLAPDNDDPLKRSGKARPLAFSYNIIAMKCLFQVIGRLWRDSGVQAAFLRSNEYYLSDCARSDKDRFI